MNQERRKEEQTEKLFSCFPGFLIPFFFIVSLSDDAEDVVLAHDQESFAVDFDFGAAVFRNEDLVPFLHGEIHLFALFVHLTGAESDHFAFLRFFFRSIGNDDPAFFCFLLFERLHQHPISERFYVHSCHKLINSFLVFCFWLSRRPRKLSGPPANCFGYFFLSSSTTSNSASTTSPSRRAPSPCESPELPVMEIFCSLPVPRSLAET